MRTLLTGIFALTLLCGFTPAQDSTPPANGSPSPSQIQPDQAQPNQAQPGQGQQTPGPATSTSTRASGTPRLAAGSVIPVQLTRSIDAKKAKTGDEVDAKVTQDLKAGNGEVVVPKDTKVVGHVTAAQARNKEVKESQLGIAFDHAVMKNAGDVPLPMSIQAIIAPPSLEGDNGGQASSSSGGGAPGSDTARPAGMSSAPQAPASSTVGGDSPASGQAGSNVHEPITGATQGVVGISNLKLSTSDDPAHGSLVSSEKNNVKLESGTLMLLRVNQ